MRNNTHSLVNIFDSLLRASGFKGEFRLDDATLLVNATDNSIYEVKPLAVAMPSDASDIKLMLDLANQVEFQSLYFCARGGGTGTNGQSLTNGVVIDFSRYMNRVIEFNSDAKTITVEPGIILSELNRFLQPHGLFFAPNVSTADRATIGGMIATDAAGKGSLIYGKTADHVLGLNLFLANGQQIDTITDNLPSEVNDFIVNKLADTVIQSEITQRFPKLKRPLSGYNLKHCYQNNQVNLNYLIAGSEGTLGLVTAAKLNLLPIPKFKALIAIHYPSFIRALEDAELLIKFQPLAIEVLDEKVQAAASKLGDWSHIAALLGAKSENIISNFMEIVANSADELNNKLVQIEQSLQAQLANYVVIRDSGQINRLWGMRSQAVGLVGRTSVEAKPVAFIEDAIVPPENLAQFVSELKNKLDELNLSYAMYGHVDVGCIHVRPALDLQNPQERLLIRQLTEIMVEMTKRYGGILWGEHGKGYRGEFVPNVFGKTLYEVMCEIKAYFDPQNRFNPLKLSAPNPQVALHKIDEIVMRGELDAVISPDLQQEFADALLCNGNGACFNLDLSNVMCPSYKATGNRIHSPKGRAVLIKEWLRSKSANEQVAEKKAAELAYTALMGCLGCKACTGKCPTQVSIPDLRTKFLHSYHKQYSKRKVRDLMLGYIENLLPLAAKFPQIWNFVHKNHLAPTFGLANIPLFKNEKSLNRGLKQLNVNIYTSAKDIANMPPNAVVIFADVFTGYLDNNVLFSTVELLKSLGKIPYVIYPRSSGKALIWSGFIQEFKRNSQKLSGILNPLLDAKIPVVALENSITIMLRDEVSKFAQPLTGQVFTLGELLAQYLTSFAELSGVTSSNKYRLLPHCSEQAVLPNEGKYWSDVFKTLGVTLNVVNSGCCGMSGTYGHLAEHQLTSQAIFRQNWQQNAEATDVVVLASGFSCRAQTDKQIKQKLLHPIEIINQLVQERNYRE